MYVAFLLLGCISFYMLVNWISDDLRPRYQAAMEESMVDMATLLASIVEEQLAQGADPADDLRAAFTRAHQRTLAAQIYEFTKTRMNLRVYVTDAKGIVLFDSDNGRDEGKDYSRWNDVYLTLRGKYGARATRIDPDDPMTAILHVAAPIHRDGQLAGVLTVAKPADSVALFLYTAQKEIVTAGFIAAGAVILLGFAISFWISWPIDKLTAYAKAIRDGRRVPPPRLGYSEIGALGAAFEEMRTALEGKQYVEDYVQTLTHQMKSPLSAIRGAAELLEEDMLPEQRQKFLDNLRSETARIQDLIDRMLLLAAVENRKELRDAEEINLESLLTEVIAEMQPALVSKEVRVTLQSEDEIVVVGERFLLTQALANLLQNALDFSSQGSKIQIKISQGEANARIVIQDAGPGIPDYALDKIFDRFYSLSRPNTGKKSSGLGLALVREVATLHHGHVTLENLPSGGAQATLELPKQ